MAQHPYGISLHREIAKTASSMSAMHAHDTHELYFLLSGKRRYFVGHTIYDVSPGNLVLIPRTRLHRTTAPGQSGYARFVLNFSEEMHRATVDLIGDEQFRTLMERGCLQLPQNIAWQVQRDLEQLEHELTVTSPLTRSVATHLLQDILICALRYGKEKAPMHGNTADKIQQTARYISENYAEPLTLEQTAQTAFMEKTYFSKRFKALTGFGFQEYLTQTRIAAAEQLLQNTELTMGEIAERCGFSGGNYFGDVFLRTKGISPSAYRQQYRD